MAVSQLLRAGLRLAALVSYLTDIDWLTDEVDDARRDDWDLDHPADAVCEECGFQWHAGLIPATCDAPAEPRSPDCPWCGA